MNEILYPVWGRCGGVEQNELYTMKIYYNKHFFGQKKLSVTWIRRILIQYKHGKATLSSFFKVKIVEGLLIREKIPKYSGTHLSPLSILTTRETVEHGYKLIKRKSLDIN